jgi:CDP-glucose 4,6-dehydratase
MGLGRCALENLGLSLMLATEFWASQRVLLTGHTGFKGSWLSLWLEALGSRVFGFALPPDQTPSLYSKIEPINRLHSIIGDVRDVGAVKQASTWRRSLWSDDRIGSLRRHGQPT